MATVRWTVDNFPNLEYEDANYILWFKDFVKDLNEKMIGIGMEFISTNFNYETFAFPDMISGTSLSSVSDICQFVYKFPVGNGVTEFELDSSGDYYNIKSNNHDNTKCYLRLNFIFAKINLNVASTIRSQREQLMVTYSIGGDLSTTTTTGLLNFWTFIPQHYYYYNSTGTQYGGRTLYNDYSCAIHLSENEFILKIFSGAYRANGSFVPYSIPLIDIDIYRENGTVVTHNNSTGYTGDSNGGSTNKYNSYQYVMDFSQPNSAYIYSYYKWNDDYKLTAYDNYGEIPTVSIPYVSRDSNNYKPNRTLPNIVIVNSTHITASASGFETIVKYKGYNVKRTFYPPKNVNWQNILINSNNANSTVSTFAYYMG